MYFIEETIHKLFMDIRKRYNVSIVCMEYNKWNTDCTLKIRFKAIDLSIIYIFSEAMLSSLCADYPSLRKFVFSVIDDHIQQYVNSVFYVKEKNDDRNH